jgi:RNA methyltransferase, TrmH family
MPLKKYQRDFPHSYTFGVFPTLELLHHQPSHVQRVLISADGERNQGVAKLRDLCAEKRIPIEVNDKQIERLSPKENTYAVGVFDKYQPRLAPDANHLVLVNPSDMGNLGTIIRTMVGFDVNNLALVKPAADIFDPRVIRASMGAVFHLNFAYFDSFDVYRSAFPQNVYPFMTDGATPLHEAAFDPPFALIFGSESAGLSGIFHTFGTSITIPHSNAIDSLNLSVAVGIALYAATKGGV